MCTQSVNYKAYQQVLDLAGGKKRTSKLSQETPSAPKKRTKSGCLTCRRRKKKCDEEKVGGKCQACIRNFLDCCWPGETVQPSEIKTEKVAVPETPTKGASAYPSPLMSPESECRDDYKDIKPLVLPESKFKVAKPKKATRKSPAQFIVTSFDLERALCQLKA